MRRFPLISFFTIACLITWSIWIPRALAAQGVIALEIPDILNNIAYFIGPPLAAVIVTWRVDGAAATQDLLRRLMIWRVGWQWYLITLLTRAVIILLALALGLALGSTAPSAIQALLAISAPALALDFAGRIFAHSGEELAWRGYLLTHTQRSLRPIAASVLVALLWGVWHLPLFFTPDEPQYGTRFLVFQIWLIAISLIHTLIYNNTKGSVLIASAFHAAYNTTTTHLPGVSVGLDLISTWLIAGLMTLIVRPQRQ
jgi:uncharacterized protein